MNPNDELSLSLGELIHALIDDISSSISDGHVAQLEKIDRLQASLGFAPIEFAQQFASINELANFSNILFGRDIYSQKLTAAEYRKLEEQYPLIIAQIFTPIGRRSTSNFNASVNKIKLYVESQWAIGKQNEIKEIIARGELPRIRIDGGEVAVRFFINTVKTRNRTSAKTEAINNSSPKQAIGKIMATSGGFKFDVSTNVAKLGSANAVSSIVLQFKTY